MNEEQNELDSIKEGIEYRLQQLLHRRERILRILIENENQIDTARSNLDELSKLTERTANNETI